MFISVVEIVALLSTFATRVPPSGQHYIEWLCMRHRHEDTGDVLSVKQCIAILSQCRVAHCTSAFYYTCNSPIENCVQLTPTVCFNYQICVLSNDPRHLYLFLQLLPSV